MRGRQIGKWIDRREAAEPQREERWSTEQPPSPRKRFWQIARWTLLLALVLAVGWWVRREGGYRRFIAALREGKVVSVEYQPYPNSAFVTVNDEKNLEAVASWVRDARPMDLRYGSMTAADCEMRITMADGSVKRIWMGQTGPQRSGGTLLPSNVYIRIRGEGWERVGFSGGLSSLYMRLPVSAQLPFSSIPAVVLPTGGIPAIATAPSNLGEVDASLAQPLMERGELGAARRVLARAIAANANDGSAQQFMLDVQARIRLRLPQMIRELERDLAENARGMEREKYLQLREKLAEMTLMAESGDERIADLRKRLGRLRPEPRIQDFKEVLRLGGNAADRYGIRDFAWSPDGTTIAACGKDGRVRIWDTINGQLLESFPAAPGEKVYFSDDGQKVWIWNDQERTWWDVNSGKPATEGKVADDRRRPSYQFELVDSHTITIWSTEQSLTVTKVLAGHAGTLKLAKSSPDYDQLATFAEDKVLCIWGDGEPRGFDQISPYERLRRVKDLDGPGVFLEDGSILVFARQPGEGKTTDAWPLSYIDLPDQVRQVQWAARRQRLLVSMADGNLSVVQPDAKKVYRINQPQGSCGRAAISADGKTVAIGNLDGSVRLINAETGESIATLQCPPARNRNWAAVEFSADGGWLMACGSGCVSVWNLQARVQIFYTEKAVSEGVAATFTRDGKGMAIIYKDGGLRLLKSSLRESDAVGWDQTALRDPTFSRDGRWIAAIGKAGGVLIADASGAQVGYVEVKLLTKSDEAIQFNEDGSALLVRADDGSVRVVDVPSGRELRRLKINDESNWMQLPASFSADGKYLMTGPVIWGAP